MIKINNIKLYGSKINRRYFPNSERMFPIIELCLCKNIIKYNVVDLVITEFFYVKPIFYNCLCYE